MSISKQTKQAYIVINICFYAAVVFFVYYSFFSEAGSINYMFGGTPTLDGLNRLDYLNSIFPIFMTVLMGSYFALLILNIKQDLWRRVILNTCIVLLLTPLYYFSVPITFIAFMVGLMLLEILDALLTSPMSFFQ